jgi:HK97 family phage major capsid protein
MKKIASKLREERKAKIAEAEKLVAINETRDMSDVEADELKACKMSITALTTRIDALEDSLDKDVDAEDTNDEINVDSDDPAFDDDNDKASRKRGVAKPSRGLRSLPTRFKDFGDHNEFAARNGYNYREGCVAQYEQRALKGLVKEMSDEIYRRSEWKIPPRGFYIPFDMSRLNKINGVETRDLTTTTGAGGYELKFQENDWIEYLRPYLVGPKLGIKYLSNPDAQFQIPRQNAASTAAVVAEAGSISNSNPTLDYIKFTPRNCTAIVPVTRQFFATAAFDANDFVKEDLLSQIAVKLENEIFNGNPSVNAAENYGLFYDVNANAYSTTSGNSYVPQWNDVISMKNSVMAANVPMVNTGWVTSPYGLSLLQKTAKQATGQSTTYPIMLIDDDGNMAGDPVVQTNNIPNNFTVSGVTGHTFTGLIFGAWNQYIFASFGPQAIDCVVDPYTLGSTGEIRLMAYFLYDHAARHDTAFTVCTNVETS